MGPERCPLSPDAPSKLRRNSRQSPLIKKATHSVRLLSSQVRAAVPQHFPVWGAQSLRVGGKVGGSRPCGREGELSTKFILSYSCNAPRSLLCCWL